MRELKFSQALNEALHQEMERDEDVFVLGQDVGKMGGDFGVTKGLWKKYGDRRVIDTPLSEAAMVGLSNGAAFTGLRPVVEIMFADFITECFDQIVNNSAKAHYMFAGQLTAPMVLRTASGGGFRAAYHHSQNPEAWLMNIPGITVVAPSTPYEAKGLLTASIRSENPIIFFEHKMLYSTSGEVPEEPYTLKLGKAEVKKEGKDVTVIASMKMCEYAMRAAEELAEEGISVEVIDPRTLVPFDRETIFDSVAKTNRVVVAYEAPKTGGYGAEITGMLNDEMFEFLKAPVKRVASLDSPVAFSPKLEDHIIPEYSQVLEGIKEVIDY